MKDANRRCQAFERQQKDSRIKNTMTRAHSDGFRLRQITCPLGVGPFKE